MSRPGIPARIEDGYIRVRNALLRRLGWQATINAHLSYGGPEEVRVLARVLMVDPDRRTDRVSRVRRTADRRGWRAFITAEVPGVELVIDIDGTTHRVRTDRAGNVDTRVANPGLAPGWRSVTLCPAADPSAGVDVPVLVVDPKVTLGLISDIDDTILSSSVPRPLLAFYNTVVRRGRAREPVPGMAELIEDLLRESPGAPVVYVSTGAWNLEAMQQEFIRTRGFPRGPLLLTDWGPTHTGWFRSGQSHKRTSIRALMDDFPAIRWVLLGDDGQHDPSLYAEAAREHPGRVRLIAIRQVGRLGDRHQPGPDAGAHPPGELPDTVPEIRGPDGYTLREQLGRTLLSDG